MSYYIKYCKFKGGKITMISHSCMLVVQCHDNPQSCCFKTKLFKFKLSSAKIVCYKGPSFLLHVSHTLTCSSQPLDGTARRCSEQRLHTPWPHARQWCLRSFMVKSVSQTQHLMISLSGIQYAGLAASTMSPERELHKKVLVSWLSKFMICFHELILNTDLSQIRIKGLSMFFIKFENDIICDKRNESDVGDVVFEILTKTVFQFLCFILFLALSNPS